MTGLLEIAFCLSLVIGGGAVWTARRLAQDIDTLMQRTAQNSVRIWRVEQALRDDGR